VALAAAIWVVSFAMRRWQHPGTGDTTTSPAE